MVLFILFLLGLCVGSFLNVLIDRLPKGQSVVYGRSHCDFCKHQLCWYELIPVISYIIQKGKSRCCHKKLSFQYPLIEFVTALGFVVVFYFMAYSHTFPPAIIVNFKSLIFNPLFLISYITVLIIFCSLLVIFVADLKYEIIPIEMIIAGVLGAVFLLVINYTHMFSSPLDYRHVISDYIFPSFGVALFFFCLWFFSKGKAMGDGDVSLSFLLSLILGYPNIIVSLYTAFLTGAITGVILMMGRKKSLKSHIPFGPFLIFGLVISLVWGETILSFWRQLL